MRTQLAKLGSDTRFAFRGKFARYGYKRNHDRSGFEHYVPTIMLTNVQVYTNDQWHDVTNHLWFNLTKGFAKLGLLAKGDLILFHGRVNDYFKGYFTQIAQHDFKLSYPTQIKYAKSKDNIIPLPSERNAIVGLIMNLEWNFYKSNGRPIDSFCLSSFANSKEAHTYNYGVKIH